LQGFESVKGIVLEAELFAVENELLTPTLKMRRQQLLVSPFPSLIQLACQGTGYLSYTKVARYGIIILMIALADERMFLDDGPHFEDFLKALIVQAKYKPAFSALYATFGESDPL
jgi:hypothetical protein